MRKHTLDAIHKSLFATKVLSTKFEIRRLGSYYNSIIVCTSHVTIHVNYKRLKCPVMVNEKTQKPAFTHPQIAEISE